MTSSGRRRRGARLVVVRAREALLIDAVPNVGPYRGPIETPQFNWPRAPLRAVPPEPGLVGLVKAGTLLDFDHRSITQSLRARACARGPAAHFGAYAKRTMGSVCVEACCRWVTWIQ